MSASAAPDALSRTAAFAADQARMVLSHDPTMWRRLVDTGGNLAVNLAIAIVILAITAWVAQWADKLVDRSIGRLNRSHPKDTTLQSFAASAARNAVVAVGLIAVLQQLGVKTTSIIAVLGAASLAIGLALQGALSNVAAGLMILLFRPYRVGDIVESLGRTGRVRALDLVVTEMETLDGLKIVIPNAKVFGDVIINHSAEALRRADVAFHVPIGADVQAVMAGLRARAEADPRVLKTPPPLVEVTGMAEAWVEIASRPWVARPDYPAVKADQLLCARLLQADPKAALPPLPKLAEPAPAALGKAFSRVRPAKGTPAARRR